MKLIFLYIYMALTIACTMASPLPVDNKRVSSDSLDLTKKYAPEPPTTHHVVLGIVFTGTDHDPRTELVPIGIDLYGTMVPRTALNFYQYADTKKSYRNSENPWDRDLDRILPTGAIESVHFSPSPAEETSDMASLFQENFGLTHDRPGRVSMASDDEGSKFMIWTSGMPYEGDNVVFGQVTSGLKDLMDRVANVKTDENGKPDQPITISYTSISVNKLPDPKRAHEQYLESLQDYQNGELDKGVTLKTYLYYDNQRDLEDTEYNQLHHPLPRIMLGISALIACYAVAKYRKRIFGRFSSKIISIRED
ncbi:peptidylprolyl isomerase family protein CPR8 [Saccharomyces eubayanus]|uniref:peptidylprolyl isomerase family protein CPR8 n=1 Tax=Saccharomyces eubayanus TaxID=1080349 RepID=UPI0006C696FC|nr:CPR8-like protein [Saccharomyces eubayanus]KOG97178.1 CPR8-like protein [Saccharomyces eubayanus]